MLRTVLLGLWPALSWASTHEWWRSEAPTGEVADDIKVVDYSPSTAYARFGVQCPGCFETDDSLVFDLQVNPADDLRTSTVVVNNIELDISRRDTASHFLHVPDSTGLQHSVELSWIRIDDSALSSLHTDDGVIQSVHFSATLHQTDVALPPSVGFTAIMRPTSQAQDRLVGVISDSDSHFIDFCHREEESLLGSPAFENGVYDSDSPSDDDSFDLGVELESLALLESKAREIQTQIAAKKKAIAANVKQEREKLCLKHLVQECDGIICAAKAVVQRLCDKVGIPTKPSFQYTHFNSKHMQNMIALDSKMDMEKADWSKYHEDIEHHTEEANIPLMLTKNVSDFSFKPIDLVNPPNPLLKALQIIGAALGITALFVFLKRRCMSMRRRVERQPTWKNEGRREHIDEQHEEH